MGSLGGGGDGVSLSVVVGGVRTGAVVRGAVRVRAVVSARVRVIARGVRVRVRVRGGVRPVVGRVRPGSAGEPLGYRSAPAVADCLPRSYHPVPLPGFETVRIGSNGSNRFGRVRTIQNGSNGSNRIEPVRT